MTKILVSGLLVLLSGLPMTGAYGGFYRWVDEHGNVHYSDNIPPEQVGAEHTELSDRGIPVNRIGRAKTPQEVQREKELERVRAEQERLLEKQRAADRVLLRTFRSADDINMARDGKIASIDVMINVTKNNIRRQQNALLRLRTEAANLERAGKPIAQQLNDKILQTERGIRDAYGSILSREEQKKAIYSSFEKDLARFRYLKDLPTPDSPDPARPLRPIVHNIIACTESEACDRLWHKAVDYVRRHATTEVQTSSADLFITAPPDTTTDIGLILSRINDRQGSGASLFLDLQCHRSLLAKTSCRSESALKIIEGFRAAIVAEQEAGP